jgi:hypothetical protein
MSLKRWFPIKLCITTIKSKILVIMQLFRTKRNMQRDKSTYLSPTKSYSYALALLKLPVFRSIARSSTRRKHRAQTCKVDKQEQLRTIHQSREALKERRVWLGSRTQETLRVELSRYLDYITQRLWAWYILIK